MDWLDLFERVAEDAPHLLADVVKTVNAARHGKGGVGKVANVVGDVAATAEEALGAATGNQSNG